MLLHLQQPQVQKFLLRCLQPPQIEPYCQLSAEELLEGSKQYAVDDAIIRLFKNLGGYGTRDSPITVKLPENVNIEFASMGEIPGLFEPIQITLRVWRES